MRSGKVWIPHLGRHFWNHLLELWNILKMQNVKNAWSLIYNWAFQNRNISEHTGQRESLQQPEPQNTAMWATATTSKAFPVHERRGSLGRVPWVLPLPSCEFCSTRWRTSQEWRAELPWARPQAEYLSQNVGRRIMSEKVDRAQIYLSTSNAVCLAKLSEL